jgi:D-serine deaminase-like pyridoxal phosphate-dependent protein
MQIAAREIRSSSQSPNFIVSAGGSQYFDRVVEWLGATALPDCQLVLRTGGYVTHDSGTFDRFSPLGNQSWRKIPGDRLIPALEIWSSVISIPEPGLAILGMGGRDMPTDLELPTPLHHFRGDGFVDSVTSSWRIIRSNDQHAYMSFSDSDNLRVGDFVGSGISHPCTAFDKWRSLLLVDDDYQVLDIIKTYF